MSHVNTTRQLEDFNLIQLNRKEIVYRSRGGVYADPYSDCDFLFGEKLT